ncbi:MULTISPECIES: hypothetical protein [Kitasatospora]|uniref:Integral membrane protein n=1 Tax=Kitasatospora cystarginea TaxID=58350 RepID=A0ABN3EAK0_9ACTN
MLDNGHLPDRRLWLRSALWAFLLCVASVAAEITDSLLYDHYVVEPTRHCHHAGAVPPLAIGLGALSTLLALVTAVWLIRLLSTAPRGGGAPVRAVQAGLVVLLLLVTLLLVADVLSLWTELDPPELDPFNCGE